MFQGGAQVRKPGNCSLGLMLGRCAGRSLQHNWEAPGRWRLLPDSRADGGLLGPALLPDSARAGGLAPGPKAGLKPVEPPAHACSSRREAAIALLGKCFIFISLSVVEFPIVLARRTLSLVDE